MAGLVAWVRQGLKVWPGNREDGGGAQEGGGATGFNRNPRVLIGILGKFVFSVELPKFFMFFHVFSFFFYPLFFTCFMLRATQK